MLEIDHLKAGYGEGEILVDVSLSVRDGEIVSLLGRNGAGKTTTLRSIMGLANVKSGEIRAFDRDLGALRTFERARLGLCLVPEDRSIFATLTVEENLRIARRSRSNWCLTDVYRHFGRLQERRRMRAGTLSGGEQQMLAIARALLNAPRLLMLDEPTEGLAPIIVQEIAAIIPTIRELGISVLLVEQNLSFCRAVSDRVYVMDSGLIVHEGDARGFDEHHSAVVNYLTI